MTASTLDHSLLVDDFAYDLPVALIAQAPPPERDAGRMLVLERSSGDLHHSAVRDLPSWLAPGDLLVVNNSRVIPARLRAQKLGTGGAVELLLLRRVSPGRWTALARPVRRLRVGGVLTLTPRRSTSAPAVEVVIAGIGDEGLVEVVLGYAEERLHEFGATPLPPYITESLPDPERYQTIYAEREGSAAAPTAGLHFTPKLIERLRQRGIGWSEVTLHVGLDTFRPITVERVADHTMHREWYEVPDETARAVAWTKERGGRVIAVGTTAARTLETLGQAIDFARPRGIRGETDLFIVPGYSWRIVDGMLTNFHLPRSTLLMMVSALAGIESTRRAYAAAIAAEYRFYSFGDAMLIL